MLIHYDFHSTLLQDDSIPHPIQFWSWVANCATLELCRQTSCNVLDYSERWTNALQLKRVCLTVGGGEAAGGALLGKMENGKLCSIRLEKNEKLKFLKVEPFPARNVFF